jgi:hypothetical protein
MEIMVLPLFVEGLAVGIMLWGKWVFPFIFKNLVNINGVSRMRISLLM